MKKKRGGSGGANWMDTYGDMVTLLLCFFVMLYSMSTLDKEKWIALVQSFNPSAVTEDATGGTGGTFESTDEMLEQMTQEQVDADIEEFLDSSVIEFSGGYRVVGTEIDIGTIHIGLYILSEIVHRLSVQREPVSHIRVIRRNLLLIALRVADDLRRFGPEIIAEKGEEMDCLIIGGIEEGSGTLHIIKHIRVLSIAQSLERFLTSDTVDSEALRFLELLDSFFG